MKVLLTRPTEDAISTSNYLKNLSIQADDSDTPDGPRKWRNLRLKNNIT